MIIAFLKDTEIDNFGTNFEAIMKKIDDFWQAERR